MLEMFKNFRSLKSANRSAKLKLQIDRVFEKSLNEIDFKSYQLISKRSKSQARQESIAFLLNNSIEGGIYVEIGACDGKKISNTYALNKYYGFRGILVEPNPLFFNLLLRNRPGNIFEDSVCMELTGKTFDFFCNKFGELSTTNIEYKDGWENIRNRDVKVLQKRSISLADLVNDRLIGEDINFLSIDVEGAEVQVLSTISKVKAKIYVICVEHSGDYAKRMEIYELLRKENFKLLKFPFSYWDDWYVHGDLQCNKFDLQFQEI